MVINKMSWAPKRDDRIQAHLPILDSLVSMLNARETAGSERSRSREELIGSSQFYITLRDHFDRWIEGGKIDPCPNDRHRSLHGDTLRYNLDENGVAQFSVDFHHPDGISGTLGPKEHAEMWFLLFLARDGRRLLSKCSECGRYFLRKRLPKRGWDPIYGEFCDHHKSQVRVRSTKKTREQELHRRIELVASLLAEWRSRKRATDWKKWVVVEFNERHRKDKESPVKQAWVTRHQREIDQRARKSTPG
jgi:hypothetical protein